MPAERVSPSGGWRRVYDALGVRPSGPGRGSDRAVVARQRRPDDRR